MFVFGTGNAVGEGREVDDGVESIPPFLHRLVFLWCYSGGGGGVKGGSRRARSGEVLQSSI